MTVTVKVHKTDLTEVDVGASVSREVFLVKKAEVRKGGRNPYYDVEVANKFGDIKLKIWDPDVPIKEGRYIELHLLGTEHPKYGKQWRVKKYSLIDYEGDDEFPEIVEERTLNMGEMMASVLDTGKSLRNPTCSAIYVEYLKQIVESDRIFKVIPYSREGGFYKHGLLDISVRLSRAACRASSEFPGVCKDLLILASMLHSIGSLDMFDVRGDYQDRFIESEDSAFYSIGELSQKRISELANSAYAEGKDIDSLTVKTLKAICKEMVTDGPFRTVEGSLLSGIIRTLLFQERYETSRKNSGNSLLFRSAPDRFINVGKITND